MGASVDPSSDVNVTAPVPVTMAQSGGAQTASPPELDEPPSPLELEEEPGPSLSPDDPELVSRVLDEGCSSPVDDPSLVPLDEAASVPLALDVSSPQAEVRARIGSRRQTRRVIGRT